MLEELRREKRTMESPARKDAVVSLPATLMKISRDSEFLQAIGTHMNSALFKIISSFRTAPFSFCLRI